MVMTVTGCTINNLKQLACLSNNIVLTFVSNMVLSFGCWLILDVS